MKICILAGGKGSRLWPLSRTNNPKQFLKINDQDSFLQSTVRRSLEIVNPEDIFVLTLADYKQQVKDDLLTINAQLTQNIIIEPCGKNTAPSIALAIQYALEILHLDENEIFLVCPSDHLISPNDQFALQVKAAKQLAEENFLVIFGAVPNKAETGYGYIKKNLLKLHGEGYLVEKFKEKPIEADAIKYFESGEYLWNTGMITFKIKNMVEEFNKYAPQIGNLMASGYDNMYLNFHNLPNISIDYAVLEKSNQTLVLPFKMNWSDIGNWGSFYEALHDENKDNFTFGESINIESKGNLIINSSDRMIATIGLEDLVIVETDDAILIAKKSHSEKVKQLVESLELRDSVEIIEHHTSRRPWGYYTIIEDKNGYKVKRIVVNAGAKLSLQMHHHRDEHWVIVKGLASVTKGKEQFKLHDNESIFIPKLTLHRIENIGSTPLEFIETQCGDYLEEDDIVRIEDIYGRVD